jgi:hypothetical protein
MGADDDSAESSPSANCSNPAQLLNAALKRHNPMLSAYQVMGMNIVATVPYAPEPDVAAIRDDENPDRRYGDRFYLLADVLSENDKGIIDGKRDSYRAHPSCMLAHFAHSRSPLA